MTDAEKLKKLEIKYKLLAKKHREYLMQENNKKVRAEQQQQKNNKVILALSNKILELSPDDDLIKNQDFIKKILKNKEK